MSNTSSNGAATVRPLSTFRVLGNTVYVSGQVGVRDGKIVDGFEAQTLRTFENLISVLDEAGSSVSKVVKCGCYIRDKAYADEFNRLYANFFAPGPYPARTTIVGGPTTDAVLVEIEAIASL
jgi:2-iminobutanoate/2-iminopropanoate deaminase